MASAAGRESIVNINSIGSAVLILSRQFRRLAEAAGAQWTEEDDNEIAHAAELIVDEAFTCVSTDQFCGIG